MDSLLALYEQGTFRQAHEWHDSVLMDATVRAFEREQLIVSHNLSGEHKGYAHPMAKHDIAQYVDHLKGPERKDLGYSPERRKVMSGMPPRRYGHLAKRVYWLQPATIMEVGTWNGDRALALLERAPQAHYYGFDYFDAWEPDVDTLEMNVKKPVPLNVVQEKLAKYNATLTRGNTRFKNLFHPRSA